MNTNAYRSALGKFATGVCVVTGVRDGKKLGMTINSFSSVSLDPSLVLWSLKKDAATYDLFSSLDDYVINVLSEGQEDISSKYARFGDHVMDEDDFTMSTEGLPIVSGSISFFICKKWSVLEAGDHEILIGSVSRYGIFSEENPLLFYKGKYRLLA